MSTKTVSSSGLLKSENDGNNIKNLHRFDSEGFLEKSLKIKSALKSSEKSLECIEKVHEFYYFFVGLKTVDRDLNQYKIVVSLLGSGNKNLS